MSLDPHPARRSSTARGAPLAPNGWRHLPEIDGWWSSAENTGGVCIGVPPTSGLYAPQRRYRPRGVRGIWTVCWAKGSLREVVDATARAAVQYAAFEESRILEDLHPADVVPYIIPLTKSEIALLTWDPRVPPSLRRWIACGMR